MLHGQKMYKSILKRSHLRCEWIQTAWEQNAGRTEFWAWLHSSVANSFLVILWPEIRAQHGIEWRGSIYWCIDQWQYCFALHLHYVLRHAQYATVLLLLGSISTDLLCTSFTFLCPMQIFIWSHHHGHQKSSTHVHLGSFSLVLHVNTDLCMQRKENDKKELCK